MLIATLAPLPQVEYEDSIYTLHTQSKPAAVAGVASGIANSTRIRVAIVSLRKCPMKCVMARPLLLDATTFTQRLVARCERSHVEDAQNKSPAEAGRCTGCLFTTYVNLRASRSGHRRTCRRRRSLARVRRRPAVQ